MIQNKSAKSVSKKIKPSGYKSVSIRRVQGQFRDGRKVTGKIYVGSILSVDVYIQNCSFKESTKIPPYCDHFDREQSRR